MTISKSIRYATDREQVLQDLYSNIEVLSRFVRDVKAAPSPSASSSTGPTSTISRNSLTCSSPRTPLPASRRWSPPRSGAATTTPPLRRMTTILGPSKP
jgi:hypothetical protein